MGSNDVIIVIIIASFGTSVMHDVGMGGILDDVSKGGTNKDSDPRNYFDLGSPSTIVFKLLTGFGIVSIGKVLLLYTVGMNVWEDLQP